VWAGINVVVAVVVVFVVVVHGPLLHRRRGTEQPQFVVEWVRKLMAHAQKPDFIFH
jgi:hypothetical protein